MMQSATVLVKNIEYDATRTGIVSYAEAGTTRGVLLPIGGELLVRHYGELYQGEFEFYARQRNNGLRGWDSGKVLWPGLALLSR